MAAGYPTWADMPTINRDLLAPLHGVSAGYLSLVFVLTAIAAAGAGAWVYQIQTGIGQTNLHPPVFWGAYIASFVYWIGVSHSGTFISGVLRLTKAQWRRPVTRIAELMTIISVTIAMLFVFYHLGRVWRWYYLIPYPNQREIWPNFRSPLMWDAMAVFTYSTSSAIYLYLPLIPDFALARDRIGGWRKRLYAMLCLGWKGTQKEWELLNTAIRIITPLIVMVMISVHSIVGWDFGMSLVPGWHSTVIAPYFVIGAVHSGLGMVVIGMYFVRRTYRLEAYIGPEHFDKMGKLLVVTTLSLAYLYFADQLTVWYGQIPDHVAILTAIVSGVYAAPFWIDAYADLCHSALHRDATGLSPVAARHDAGRHRHQSRHVYRADVDHRSAAGTAPIAVQLEQLFPVMGRADHALGIVRPGDPPLSVGGQIRADHFHMGRKGRTFALL